MLAVRNDERLTLIFSIATLNLLVLVLLYVSLQNSGSSRFVETSGFQNMGRIDPVIVSPAHDMFF